MERIAWFRRSARRQALQSLGIPPDPVRGFAEQVTFTGQEAALLALPFWSGQVIGVDQPLQAPDGTGYFMAGISEAGGPDPVG